MRGLLVDEIRGWETGTMLSARLPAASLASCVVLAIACSSGGGDASHPGTGGADSGAQGGTGGAGATGGAGGNAGAGANAGAAGSGGSAGSAGGADSGSPAPTWSITVPDANLLDCLVDDTGVYLLIYESGASRVERRLLSDGSLDPSFIASNVMATDAGVLAENSSALFVVSSYGAMTRLAKTGGAIGWQTPEDPSVSFLHAIAADENALFAGYQGRATTYMWMIGRYAAKSGNLDQTFAAPDKTTALYPPNGPDALLVDGNELYGVGTGPIAPASDVDSQVKVVRRDAQTGALVWEKAFELAPNLQDHGVSAALGTSELYVLADETACSNGCATGWTLQKRLRSDGSLVASFGTGGSVTMDPAPSTGAEGERVILDGDVLYVGGTDSPPGVAGASGTRVEKRSASTGALDPVFGASGTLLAAPPHALRTIAVDTTSAYLCGNDVDNDAAPGTGLSAFVERRDKQTGSL